MTVFVHYAGQTFELAATVNRHAVFNEITYRLNHAWALRGDVDARPDMPRGGDPAVGDGVDYNPWITLDLAGGGTVTLHIHDGMHLSYEDTESPD